MSAAKQRGGVGVPLEREEGGGQPPAFLQLPQENLVEEVSLFVSSEGRPGAVGEAPETVTPSAPSPVVTAPAFLMDFIPCSKDAPLPRLSFSLGHVETPDRNSKYFWIPES